MKKVKFIGAILICMLFVSCDNTNKLVNEDGKNLVYVKTNKTDVPFKMYISEDIIDLKVSEDKIVEMSTYVVNYADMGAKNRMTYELPESGMLFLSDSTIVGSVMGSAENSYGVRNKISTNISFTKEDCKPIENEYGLPKIMAY